MDTLRFLGGSRNQPIFGLGFKKSANFWFGVREISQFLVWGSRNQPIFGLGFEKSANFWFGI